MLRSAQVPDEKVIAAGHQALIEGQTVTLTLMPSAMSRPGFRRVVGGLLGLVAGAIASIVLTAMWPSLMSGAGGLWGLLLALAGALIGIAAALVIPAAPWPTQLACAPATLTISFNRGPLRTIPVEDLRVLTVKGATSAPAAPNFMQLVTAADRFTLFLPSAAAAFGTIIIRARARRAVVIDHENTATVPACPAGVDTADWADHCRDIVHREFSARIRVQSLIAAALLLLGGACIAGMIFGSMNSVLVKGAITGVAGIIAAARVRRLWRQRAELLTQIESGRSADGTMRSTRPSTPPPAARRMN